MITLETGAPGSCKTLYCVDKFLRGIVGTTVTDDEGKVWPRTIYSNINGLLIDHEKIDADGLNTWHEWAKPGAFIVFDEVQKPWPLAATGSKVPKPIVELEEHRHRGVDFILMTQHPMMIHTNVARLTGRHLHMRKMGNLPLAIVYEWDGCSKTLLYKNAIAKTPYRFSKSAYHLYKSARLHTKTARKTPTLLWVCLAGLASMVYLGPTVYARMQERINPTPVVAPKVEVKPPLQLAQAPQLPTLAQVRGMPGIAPGANGVPAEPAIAGCMITGPNCACMAPNGDRVLVPTEQCMERAGAGRGPAIDIGPDTPTMVQQRAAHGDLEALGFLKQNAASLRNVSRQSDGAGLQVAQP